MPDWMPLERIGHEACSLRAWLPRWAAGRWPAGDLHRDPAGERCDEDDAEQDRSQRRAGACSDYADGLVPAGACQEPPVPTVALASGRPAWRSRYRLRKQIVKPVFGQIKQARGFRQFLLRGIDAVA